MEDTDEAIDRDEVSDERLEKEEREECMEELREEAEEPVAESELLEGRTIPCSASRSFCNSPSL